MTDTIITFVVLNYVDLNGKVTDFANTDNTAIGLDFLMGYKVVDVFSFHLQIFQWFVAPPSRRYFQGHRP
jgi:hypothetical protein